MKTTVILLLVVVFFVGCGSPVVDTSSDEALKVSLQKIRESLPDSQQEAFDDALTTLLFGQMSLQDMMAAGEGGTAVLQSKVYSSLAGKSGEEIIAEAEKIMEERAFREREQALDEIKELETSRLVAEKAKMELKNFKVLRSRFYKEKSMFSEDPIIELTVKNGTSIPVSRAYFEGTIATPGRSIPWLVETFNYSISGGLEPGETASWRLAPNMFSDWGNVKAPADAIFTVTVERLDGPDGEAAFTVQDFDNEDQKRLTELKEKYNVK